MDKKKKRKIIILVVCLVVVVGLIVTVAIVSSLKKGSQQFAQTNVDTMDFNPYVENEERSDNSLLEYGKVLSKYESKGYVKYTGEDIEIPASDFYGISFTYTNGETIALYKDDAGEYSKVTYKGKNYTYANVMAGNESFADADFIAAIEETISSISFSEDYTHDKYVDIDDYRDEDGYTTAADQDQRYTTVTTTIEADAQAVQTTAGSEITFIYKLDGDYEIKETALYSLSVEYFLPENRANTALFGLKVDSKYPFSEAENMELDRTYELYDLYSKDVGDNEIRAQQQEVFAWKTVVMTSPEGMYRNPYRFLINESSTATTEKPRTISITLSREPAVIRTIKLVAPAANDSYDEYKAANNFSESAIVSTVSQIEFENPDEKNSLSIRSEWDGDYATVPQSYKVTRYNYFGGDRWASGGDSATWTFTVEEDGWYPIGFRYKTTLTDIVAYREVKIDGVIPFAEMEEYCFPYSDGWYGCEMVDENQNPYYFYLTKGEHTITLTSKVGPLRASIQSLEESMDSISELVTTVANITGAVRNDSGGYTVDKNRDWDLDKYIIGIQDEIDSYRDTFNDIYEEMKTANGGVLPYYGSSVSVAKVLFNRLSEDLEDIPSSLNEICNVLSSLSTTLSNVKEQPLAIDYMIVGDGFDYSKCKSTVGQSLLVAATQFGDSFTKDYSIVGTRDDSEAEEEIEVYVALGREYVEMLRNLVAEEFTPETGIKVNINMVSTGVEGIVMLRYVTGTAPDVALTISASAVVEYASRGALVPLNDLDRLENGNAVGTVTNTEFEEFKEQFLSGAFTLSRYRGDYYAIPETQTWSALFYRTDIIEELDIDIPQTWDDVYNILPTLQENGYDFCYNYGVANLYPFLYQNDADVYDYNGKTSALDTDEAYNAFVEYANLYNKYNIPYAANFYMKFKMGDMPIGIADMSVYCQLKYSAPEIDGKWKMAAVPGHVKEDGTIDRSMGGSATTCVLMNKKVEDGRNVEAGWKFLKWWMDEETQVQYAQEVEATFGVGSRWSTANKNAIKRMAYSDEEVEIIQEQWSYFTETPVVLGGYYTSRYLTTALNKAVLQGENIRIALEDAVMEINKEMARKQEEFKIGENDSVQWATMKTKGDDEQ